MNVQNEKLNQKIKIVYKIEKLNQKIKMVYKTKN